MSEEGVYGGEALANRVEEDNELHNVEDENGGNLIEENGLHDGNKHTYYSHDQLEETVVELSFQNEYLKSQFVDMKNHILDSGDPEKRNKAMELDDLASNGDVRELHEKLESLKRELLEERQTRGAAEEALKHLGAAHSEADTKVQELSAKLAEAQQKMDQEIKDRDEKYSELDTKFNRLHKRAKQRIQEVQKVFFYLFLMLLLFISLSNIFILLLLFH
ncbi:protein GRIP-like [Olea europaea var. sylvestris]|uniref:protein GRIP-like n=1 Tax=Olea europaea var. sylvestris TaxID=158386 RepID=UPI000C1CEC13|nr:protein GRIP-like [Olea europaea var. sylvestris]